MTRIAFTADLHCDDFGAKIDPATGLNARWVDTVAMAGWVAEDADRRGADVLIVGGDFTEARHPAPWRVAQIADALERFPRRKIYVRGNHDGQRAGQSIVSVLGGGGFERPGVTVAGDVAIAAIPFLDPHWLRAHVEPAHPEWTDPETGVVHPATPEISWAAVPEAEVLRVLAEQYLVIAGGLYAEAAAIAPRQVLVVHQGLSGGLMSDTQRAFLGDKTLVVDGRALGAIGFDAVLAGHFHLHQVLQADPLVAYSGAPYRTDFGEEHQAKGYLVVDLTTTGHILETSMEFVETPARRFLTLTGDEIEDDVAEGQVDGAVVRVVDLAEHRDPAHVRSMLEALGAWDVQEIRRRQVLGPEVAGGLSESLTATEALVEYFAADPDVDALVDRGRGILAEVA